MIILNGRQGFHQESIRLLTHGLGDFDTAISYCLLGGSSIFRPTGSSHVPSSSLPSKPEQSILFGYLLREFLRLEDVAQRIERTGELLKRFGGWFDVGEVLGLIPDEWGVDVLGAFLIQALRQLVRDRAESEIVRSLCDAGNSIVSNELVERTEKLGPTVEKV